jgi:hypothetical protein
LLSAVGSVPHFHGLPADSVTPWSSPLSPGLFPATRPRPVLSQTPPPNPIAAEPYGRRVLSGGGGADHEVTPQAPLTGSGCREYSYGGFGGGHPHFHPHATPAGTPRIKRQARPCSKLSGSVPLFVLSWSIRSVRFVDIQRRRTTLLLCWPWAMRRPLPCQVSSATRLTCVKPGRDACGDVRD